MYNKWCWKQDLNLRPTDYETVALPTELIQHTIILSLNGLYVYCFKTFIVMPSPLFGFILEYIKSIVKIITNIVHNIIFVL